MKSSGRRTGKLLDLAQLLIVLIVLAAVAYVLICFWP